MTLLMKIMASERPALDDNTQEFTLYPLRTGHQYIIYREGGRAVMVIYDEDRREIDRYFLTGNVYVTESHKTVALFDPDTVNYRREYLQSLAIEVAKIVYQDAEENEGIDHIGDREVLIDNVRIPDAPFWFEGKIGEGDLDEFERMLNQEILKRVNHIPKSGHRFFSVVPQLPVNDLMREVEILEGGITPHRNSYWEQAYEEFMLVPATEDWIS